MKHYLSRSLTRFTWLLKRIIADISDSTEADRAKKESRLLFSSYIKRRWGTIKL